MKKTIAIIISLLLAALIPPAAFAAGYAITITPPANGSVAASTQTAESGDSVTLTVTPDDGFELELGVVTVNVGPFSEPHVFFEADDLTEGEFTFTMPDDNVTVEVLFRAKSQALLGDMDGDGSVSVADALAILRMAARLVPVTNLETADMDGDGSVSVSDALAALRIAAGLV